MNSLQRDNLLTWLAFIIAIAFVAAVILLLSVRCNAQKLSVSPTSVPIWGQSPGTAKISASYKYVEATYLYAFKTRWDNSDRKHPAKYAGGYFGLFLLTPDIRADSFEVTGGAGYFFRKFPTVNGVHINLTVKATYNLTDTIGISYSHISNGFGAFSNINPGVDNLSIVINL